MDMTFKYVSKNGEDLIFNKACDGKKCACNSCNHNYTGNCPEGCKTCFKRNHSPKEKKCFAYKPIKIEDHDEEINIYNRKKSEIVRRNRKCVR